MNNVNMTRTLVFVTGVMALAAGCVVSETTPPAPTTSSESSTQTSARTDPGGSEGTPPLVPAPDQLPPGFPRGTPIPSLQMLSATEAGGTFTLRFTTTDARADIASYDQILNTADFMKTGEVDALDGQQHSLTITAMTETMHVEASAYGPNADDGGGYMEVIVETS